MEVIDVDMLTTSEWARLQRLANHAGMVPADFAVWRNEAGIAIALVGGTRFDLTEACYTQTVRAAARGTETGPRP